MKGWIKCIIAGAVIIGVGLAIILGTLAFNGWSIKKPSFEMKSYTAENDNTALDIQIGAGSVKTEFYDGDKITVEYPSSGVFKTDISEKNGVFRYHAKTKNLWVWGSLNIPETTIKLPENISYDLDFEVDAGNVDIASGSYGKIEIDVNAGKLTLEQSECSTFDCDVSAGALEVSGLICDKFICDLSAGKIDVNNLDCPDVKADISAGELVMKIDGAKADYDIRTDVSAGSCNVSNQSGGAGKKLDVECSAGSISVTFAS